MDTKLAQKILKTEVSCLLKASQNNCNRNCSNCNLVMDTNVLIDFWGFIEKLLEEKSLSPIPVETAYKMIGKPAFLVTTDKFVLDRVTLSGCLYKKEDLFKWVIISADMIASLEKYGGFELYRNEVDYELYTK